MSKPLILVTNDDGIDSRGIRHLVEIMNHFGEVVIVAPDSPQSGMGHAITVGDKLRLVKSDANVPRHVPEMFELLLYLPLMTEIIIYTVV